MSSRKPIMAESGASDETLMERYVNGDGAAFDEIFRRYERRAFTYFSRRTGSPDRSQDLYQELFLRVHRARHAYDAQRAFAPWFFQIAHRLLIDDARRAYRSHEVPLDDPAHHAAPGDAPAEMAERDQLSRLLANLSEDERYVLHAKAAGIAYTQVGVHLGKSVVAVKKMASRAMQRLQQDAIAAQPPLRAAASQRRSE